MKGFCSRCKVVLTESNCCPSNLKENTSYTGGRYCDICRNQYQRWRREARPKPSILNRAKQRAKIKGIICTLRVEDIPDIPKFYPVFPWIKLEYRVGKGRADNSPSLDRVDNSKGYIPSNVRIISNRANQLKSDGTPRELEALVKDARKSPASPMGLKITMEKP